MRIIDNFIKYTTFLLVLITPNIFWRYGLFPHISSKTFFLYLITEVLLFSWLYVVYTDKSYRLTKTQLKWLSIPTLFVFWATLTGILSTNFNLSLWSSLGRGTGLLTLYHCLALSFVFTSLVNKHGVKYFISLLKFFVYGAFILAFSVWLGSDGFGLSTDVFKKDAGGGFGGNSTLTAGYLMFGLAASLFLVFTKDVKKRIKLFSIFTILTIIFSPVFISAYKIISGDGFIGTARGTMLAIVAGSFFTALTYLFLSQKRKLRIFSVSLLGVGVIVFGVLWAQLINPNTFIHQKFAEGARATRFIFWDVAQKAMDERPILGYGWENYPISFQKYFNPQVLTQNNSFEGWVDRAHNIYFDVGSTTGYPGIIMYALLILSIIYTIYIAYKKDKLSRIQASIFIGWVFAYVANNLFTFDSNISLMTLFVLIGIIYSLSSQNEIMHTKIDKNTSNNLLLKVLLLTLFTMSVVYFFYRPVMKSSLYARVFASAINTRPDVYKYLRGGSSVGESIEVGDLAYGIHKVYSSSPAKIKNNKEKLPYIINDISALLEYLDYISLKNKTDSRLYITKALLQNTLTYLSDRPFNQEIQDKIMSDLNYASELSPTNPNIYWIMAQTKLWNLDFKGVEDAYRKSINADPKLATSYKLTLQYAQVVGNKKLFDEVLAQAKENIPGYEFK